VVSEGNAPHPPWAEGIEIAVPDLTMFVSGNDSWQSHHDNTQTYNSQNEVNNKHNIYDLFSNNQRLIDQKNNVTHKLLI